MNFLERAAMKILERGLRDRNKIPKGITAAAHNRELRGEIVFPEDLASADVERMQAELLYYRRLAAQREAELLELQRAETLSNIEEHHRTKQIRGYLDQLEKMNLTIPGGLRSQPVAEAGEDQELVNEAWLIFCGRRRGGGSRFG
jgi:hypothetical protein